MLIHWKFCVPIHHALCTALMLKFLNEILARCSKLNQLAVTIASKSKHFTLPRKRHLDDLTGNMEIPPDSGAADGLVSNKRISL